MTDEHEPRILATNLPLPEDPIAMPGGSLVFVEIGAGQSSRWQPNGATNLCFGGAELREASITLSRTGRLARSRWPRPEIELNH